MRGALHSPFSLFYTIKAQNGKLKILGDFFASILNRTRKTLIRFPFQGRGSLPVLHVDYPSIYKGLKVDGEFHKTRKDNFPILDLFRLTLNAPAKNTTENVTC